MPRTRRSTLDMQRHGQASPLMPINKNPIYEADDEENDIEPQKKCIPTWAAILLSYTTLAGIYIAAYFGSPPRDQWESHLTECPAQAQHCKLLGHLSYVIQGVLTFTCGCVLLMAWRCEKLRRPFIRFVADNSKSVIAAMMTHFLAAGSAVLIHQITEREDAVEDCDWYLVIFVWDSIIGVSLTLIFHQWSARKFQTIPSLEFLSRIGDYEARPDPMTLEREPSTTTQRVRRWGYQVVHWLLCAFSARVIDFAILYGLAQQLARVAAGVGWWACSSHQVQIKQWLNILVFPILLDSCQFLVQNYFLKNRALMKEQEAAANLERDMVYGSTA